MGPLYITELQTNLTLTLPNNKVEYQKARLMPCYVVFAALKTYLWEGNKPWIELCEASPQ